MLDVLNYEGKLFIPLKTSHSGGRNIIIGNNNELINPYNNLNSNVVLDPRRRELNIKFNELFNTLNIDDFILHDNKTFILSDNKKDEIQSEGYEYSLEEIIIRKNNIIYFPNKDYFKDLFKERLFHTIDDFNTKYEFIEEPYPFEPNDYLKEQNHNEPFIVIRKIIMYIYMKLKINYNLVNKYQTGGGSEIHCYLCGAPVHNHSMYKLNNYKKYKKFIYDNLIDVDGMAQDKDSNIKFDVTFSIYKNLPEKILKEIYKNIENLEKKKYQWLNNVLLLHWSGKILKIDKDKSDYWDRVFFDDSGIQQSINGHSFIVHNDCYKVTKTKYGDLH